MATGSLTLACLLVAAAPVDVWHIKDRNFTIPVRIDPARRQEIKQLILYSSNDQGRTWNEVAVASADKEAFPFYAATDGLYWFNLCIVDRQGNREPSDINKAAPAQKIVVDTLKPVLRIVAAERRSDEVVVNWEIQEEHLELNTLKLEYRSIDVPANQWYSAALTPAASGQARFRIVTSGAIAVRMQVQDQAGNATTATTEVTAASVQGYTAASAPIPTVPAAPYTPTAGSSQWEHARATPPSAPHAEPPPQAETPYTSPPPSGNPLSSVPGAPNVPDDNTRLIASSESPSAPNAPANTWGATRVPRGALPAVQIVNNPQVSLEYEVAKVGPSGIGKVELWLTQDDGRTWRRFAEDSDLKPPITVELPSEGIYGFSLVVQSKAGLGRRPPIPGDPPDMRLEVDMTPPAAKLYAPEPEPRRPNTLTISWTATDRNLAANPITLQWAEKAGGSWETIGADLPNNGRHTWQLPPNLPYRVYLRLIARDTAGNTCVAETPEPRLVDLNEPEGRLLGIAGLSRRP